MSPISVFIFLSILPGINMTEVYDFGDTYDLEHLNQNINPEWNVTANAGSATVKMSLVGFPDTMCQRNGTCWTQDHNKSRLIYKRSEVTLPEDTEDTRYYLNSVRDEPTYTLTDGTIVLQLKVIVEYTVEILTTFSESCGDGCYYTWTAWVPHDYKVEVVLIDTISKPEVYVSPPYEIRVTVTNNTQIRIAKSDSDMFRKYMFGYWIKGTETFTYEDPLELKLNRTEITNTTDAWIKVLRMKPYYTIERQKTRYVGLITSYDEININGERVTTYEGEVVTHNTTIDMVWDLGPYGWIEQGSPVTYSKKEYSLEPVWAFLVALVVYAIIVVIILILVLVIGPRLLAEFL